MRKLLSCILVSIMLLTLYGCGNTENTGDEVAVNTQEDETQKDLAKANADLVKLVEKIWEDDVYSEKEMDELVKYTEPDSMDEHASNKELYGLFDEAGNQTMNWCQLIEKGYVSAYILEEKAMIESAGSYDDYDSFFSDLWEDCFVEITESGTEMDGILKLPEKIDYVSNNDGFLKGCGNLTGFYAAGYTVDKIEPGFFEGCSRLQNVELGKADSKGKEVHIEDFSGWYGFEEAAKDGPVAVANVLVTWGDSEAEEIICPMGIEYCSYELHETNKAKKIVFPTGSVTAITTMFLYDNDVIEEIVIEPGCVELKTDGWVGTFENCNKLKTIVIPDTVTSIPDNTFDGTQYLNNIWNSGERHLIINGILVKSVAFKKGNTDTKIVIDENITDISKGAFADAYNWYDGPEKELFIGEHMAVIPMDAFGDIHGDVNFSTVYLPETLVEIGYSAFEGCHINNIELPDGLKIINTNALRNNDFTKLIVPESVEKIGMWAFKDCAALTEITLPADADIDSTAFEGCTSLTKINYSGDDEDYPWGAPNMK